MHFRVGVWNIAILLCMVSLLVVSVSAEWATQRGNAAATGAIEQSVNENLQLAWKYSLGDGIEATPVVSGGRVYVGDFQGKFVCLDLKEGSVIWQTEISAAKAAAAVNKESLVVGDLDGIVHALDVQNGKEQWKFDLGGVVDSGPTIVDGKVFIASQAGELVCLSLKEGKEHWRYETSDQLRCSPTIAHGRAFLGGCDGQLHQIDIETGKAAGEPLPLESPTAATPAIVGDLAIVPTFGGMVFALDWRQGKRVWTYDDSEQQREFRTSAAVTAQVAVVTGQGKQVTAINMSDGKLLWQEALRRRSDASPVIAGESVFIAATDGQLLRMDLKSGRTTWKYEIRGSFLTSPALSDGSLIAVTDKGEVLCFR